MRRDRGKSSRRASSISTSSIDLLARSSDSLNVSREITPHSYATLLHRCNVMRKRAPLAARHEWKVLFQIPYGTMRRYLAAVSPVHCVPRARTPRRPFVNFDLMAFILPRATFVFPGSPLQPRTAPTGISVYRLGLPPQEVESSYRVTDIG